MSNRKSESSLRLRPKGATVFYKPAADITQLLPKLLSQALHMYTQDFDKGLLDFSEELSTFLHECHITELTWEEHTLPKVLNMLMKLKDNSKYGDAFLSSFFIIVLDYFRHSIRLTPEEVSSIPDMTKALSETSLIRTMPKKIREEYIEYRETYKPLSPLLCQENYYTKKKKNE